MPEPDEPQRDKPMRPSKPGRENRGVPGDKGAGGGPQQPPKTRRGGLSVARLGGNDFELVHPRCVREMELDYEEGIELWKAGDFEAARDALRYALQGCGDNVWVHVALGRIALDDLRDVALARGHFGYAFELAERALPHGFQGRLPRHRPANRPLYDAIDGLSACYKALGKQAEADKLLALARRWSGDPRPGGPKPGAQR
jgi:tetratricopeptide (TPR) repeat protein